jgi:hypothetical protein
MDRFDEALSCWEAAERAVAAAEMAFGRAVYLYLIGRGPAPEAAIADELIAARFSAIDALGTLYLALNRCRHTVPLL